MFRIVSKTAKGPDEPFKSYGTDQWKEKAIKLDRGTYIFFVSHCPGALLN